MRVLLINYEFFPLGGGGSTVTYYIGRNLAELGCEVHLITSGFRGLKREEEVDGISIHRIPVFRRRMDKSTLSEMFTFMVSGTYNALKFVRKKRPDVVHAFFGMPSGPVAYVIKKIYGIPYIVYLGGSDVPGIDRDRFGFIYDLAAPVIKLVWRNSYITTAASEGLIDFALKADPKAKIQMIPNGVDLKRFRPVKKHKKKKLRVLLIGRLIPRKGFQYLIRALPRVLDEAKTDFVVEIVGTGRYQKDLVDLAGRLGVADHVEFSGAVDYGVLHEKYQGSDVFVLPSTGEGMPCVVLEAMGCRLPIIASDVPGNKEIVFNGVNGFVVPPRDVKALEEALTSMINNPLVRERMGEESLRIVQKYGWREITEEYLSLYKEMVSQ